MSKLSLLELKGQVLKTIKNYELSPEIENEYTFFQFDLENIDLINLAGHFQTRPIAYLKQKDQKGEYLGVGETELLRNRIAGDQLQELKLKNPLLTYFCSRQFNQTKAQSNEWQDIPAWLFFIPRVLFIKESNKLRLQVQLKTSFLKNITSQMQCLLDLEKDLSFTAFEAATHQLISKSESSSQSEWEENVLKITKDIADEKYQKLVLARKSTLEFDGLVKGPNLLNQLANYSKESYLFYLELSPNEAFLSVSPEKLFSIKENLLEVDALAGTLPKDADPENLLLDQKERQEHQFVVEQIKEVIKDLSDQTNHSKTPEILSLPFVHHLYTKITAKLKKEYNYIDLIEALHPTPAVGGHPWAQTYQEQIELEPFERGLYAAPSGIVTEHKAEFLVAIRSAKVSQKKIHIYAGAGIVKDSNPTQEWFETQNKMKNFINHLVLLKNNGKDSNTESQKRNS